MRCVGAAQRNSPLSRSAAAKTRPPSEDAIHLVTHYGNRGAGKLALQRAIDVSDDDDCVEMNRVRRVKLANVPGAYS